MQSFNKMWLVCNYFVWLRQLEVILFYVEQEIFSSWTHKTDHFQRIHSRTGVPINSMLFFDDENRNIQAVKMAYIIIFLIIIIKIPFFSFAWVVASLLGVGCEFCRFWFFFFFFLPPIWLILWYLIAGLENGCNKHFGW